MVYAHNFEVMCRNIQVSLYLQYLISLQAEANLQDHTAGIISLTKKQDKSLDDISPEACLLPFYSNQKDFLFYKHWSSK